MSLDSSNNPAGVVEVEPAACLLEAPTEVVLLDKSEFEPVLAEDLKKPHIGVPHVDGALAYVVVCRKNLHHAVEWHEEGRFVSRPVVRAVAQPSVEYP